jgi:carboxyl-terminal processing protease
MNRLLLVLLGFLWLGIAATASFADVLVPKVPQPGPNDGRIAFIVARMLEQRHYTQKTFDDEVSRKFLDRYFESLDFQRSLFLQSDIAEFASLSTNLDNLTLTDSGVADVSPAFAIYSRFLTRMDERVNYVDQLLTSQTNFQFDVDEKIQINRKDEPFPASMDEARGIWKQRLRSEYLQETLARLDERKKAKDKPAEKTEKSADLAPLKTDAEYISEKLSKRYHRQLTTFREFDNDDVLQAYLNSLSHIYDPHSDYMAAPAAENFSIGMNLQLVGIGAQLSFTDGYCTLEKLFAGGPAAKSGKLTEKERIVAVGQAQGPFLDVVEMNLNKTVRLIRGEKGTIVRLKVIPAVSEGPVREISLVRDEIKLEDQAAKGKIIDQPAGDGKTVRLGVIDLPSFYASFDRSSQSFTSPDVEKLLRKFNTEKVEGVILDLRRNGGGSLEEAIKVTGLFIKDGPVVQVRSHLRNPDRGRQVLGDTDGETSYDGPLVVLTSRFSASASEIVAGALQDYGRAILVGDSSTHGKGTVQNLNPLQPFVKPASPSATNDPGEVKLTISKFYRAGGASTQLKGVIPDIILPSWLNYSEDLGEAAIETALPWDTISSAKFTRLEMVDPFLAELSRRSNDRVNRDAEYDYIREDIRRFRKRQEDKTVSLNLTERLREKEADAQREKERDKERKTRKESTAKIYEITLNNAGKPGLPPPIEKTNSVTVKATGAVVAVADGADDEDAEEKPPAVDASLQEAQNILLDYISLLNKRRIASATDAK